MAQEVKIMQAPFSMLHIWVDVDGHSRWDFGALACPFRRVKLCAGSWGNLGA